MDLELSNRPTIIAYRGGSGEAPENTMLAFDQSATLSPAVILDVDVVITKDQRLVALHDLSLDRTTDGRGLAAETNYSDLRRLDAGYHFTDDQGDHPFRGQGVRIPLLEEVITTWPKQRLHIGLNSSDPAIVPLFTALIDRTGAADRLVVTATPRVQAQLRAARPDWCFGATETEIRGLYLWSRIGLARFSPLRSAIAMVPENHGRIRLGAPWLVREIHRRGKVVWVWMIDDATTAQRLGPLGIDGWFTAYPRRLLAFITGQALV